MNDLIDLLERQVEALATQVTSRDFLVSVGPFLRALTDEPRIAVHLEDLREEAINRVRVVEQIDEEMLPGILELRRSIDTTASLKRLASQRPEDLELFDSIAAAEPEPINYKADDARAGRLLAVLQQIGGPSADVADTAQEAWSVALYNARLQWGHATRWLALEMAVSAGLALIRLDAVPRALNPDPVFRQVGEDRHARRTKILKESMSTERQFFNAVHVGELGAATDGYVNDRVAELRAGLKLLDTELHRRIGTTRSRHALISRFKQRAEWHDAKRLQTVAADTSLGGHPEDRLTAELARFLFDQGLNPLTKPIAAGLEPDLLDPAVSPAFYVEAKQYKSPDRQGLIKALRQVLDTVGRLKSDAMPITEAFCVVFRRDGPRYLLPDRFDAEGYRVYFTLIDIAPTTVSGRRQQHAPSPITIADLIAATDVAQSPPSTESDATEPATSGSDVTDRTTEPASQT